MTEEKVRALMTLADIEVRGLYEIVNKYWGRINPGAEPWWLVKTPHGLIEIGWRKRVISIDWSDMKLRAIVTGDDVTKSDRTVHAWSEAKAIEYLASLRRLADEREVDEVEV